MKAMRLRESSPHCLAGLAYFVSRATSSGVSQLVIERHQCDALVKKIEPLIARVYEHRHMRNRRDGSGRTLTQRSLKSGADAVLR